MGSAAATRGQLGPPGHTPEPLKPKIFPRGAAGPLCCAAAREGLRPVLNSTMTTNEEARAQERGRTYEIETAAYSNALLALDGMAL